MRASSLESVLSNYEVFLAFWDEAKDIAPNADARTRIAGVQFQMTTFNYLFDQPGYAIYSSLESLLLKAARKEDFSTELDTAVQFYGEDFNPSLLKLHLEMLQTSTRYQTAHAISFTWRACNPVV